MKEHKKHHPDCTTQSCDWAVVKRGDIDLAPYLTCTKGSGDCMPFNLLVPEEASRVFFNDPLRDFVEQMINIASTLPPPDDEHTYTLSIFTVLHGKTNEPGLMLGWVRHGEELPPGVKHNVVTAKSSPEAIAQALGLKKRESQEK